MKKLLLLLMCLALLPAGMAHALTDEDDLLAGQRARNLTVYDSRFYALTDGEQGKTVLAVSPGQPPEPFVTLEPEDAVTAMAAEGETLYGIHMETGRVGTLSADGIAWLPQTIDTTLFSQMPYWPGTPFLFEGSLYTPLTNITTAEDFAALALARSNLNSGETTLIEPPGAVSILPYKPGQLLLLGVEEKQGSTFWQLAAYDLASGKASPLPMRMPEAFPYADGIGALAYDPGTDRIFYAHARQMMVSSALGPFERVGLLNFDYLSTDSARGFVIDGAYAVQSGGLSLRRADAVISMDTLTIRGHVPPDAVRLFRDARPDVLPILQEQSIAAQDVFWRVRSGDDTVDIYIMPVDGGLRGLMDKGYALDLGADERLKGDADNLYPVLKTAMTNAEGKLSAVPVSLHNMNSYVRPALWQEVFGDRPYPATWKELMEFRLAFAETQRDDLIFFAFGDSPQVLKCVLEQYILRYEQPEQPHTFDHPALRDALTAYLSDKDLRLDVQPEDWVSETGPENHLFGLFASAGQFMVPNRKTPPWKSRPLCLNWGSSP